MELGRRSGLSSTPALLRPDTPARQRLPPLAILLEPAHAAEGFPSLPHGVGVLFSGLPAPLPIVPPFRGLRPALH